MKRARCLLSWSSRLPAHFLVRPPLVSTSDRFRRLLLHLARACDRPGVRAVPSIGSDFAPPTAGAVVIIQGCYRVGPGSVAFGVIGGVYTVLPLGSLVASQSCSATPHMRIPALDRALARAAAPEAARARVSSHRQRRALLDAAAGLRPKMLQEERGLSTG